MTNFQDKVKEIKQKVGKTSIYIARLPEKAKTRFKKLADEEFSGDYGFTLLWLMDFREGLLGSPNQQLADKIEVLADEIKKMKQRYEVSDTDSVIKSLDGKRIGGKQNEQTEYVIGQT